MSLIAVAVMHWRIVYIKYSGLESDPDNVDTGMGSLNVHR